MSAAIRHDSQYSIPAPLQYDRLRQVDKVIYGRIAASDLVQDRADPFFLGQQNTPLAHDNHTHGMWSCLEGARIARARMM